MTDPLSPAAKTRSDGRAGRRATDPVVAGQERETALPARTNLPVPVAPARKEEPGAAPFDAHLLGQAGQKRGLRGGEPVLNQAKSAYLGAEWSGKADRRPPKGVISKTEV